MALEEKIRKDLASAMREQKTLAVTTLRMALAALHARSIEKRTRGESPVLTDEEVLEVLTREAKKRREAAGAFTAGGRTELSEKEMKELAVLETYLPVQADDAEVEREVDAAIAEVAPRGPADMGRVMAAAMARLKGKADGARVSACVKKKLV